MRPGVVLPAGAGGGKAGCNRQVEHRAAVPADAEAQNLCGPLNGDGGEGVGEGAARVVGRMLVQPGAELFLGEAGALQGLLDGDQGVRLLVIAPGADVPVAAVAAVVQIKHQI